MCLYKLQMKSFQLRSNTNHQKILHKFEWKYGGKNVYVAGSFSNWAKIQMNKIGPLLWAASVPLYAGILQYKFIVDGVWCYDLEKPTIKDLLGNINNHLHIVSDQDPCEQPKLSFVYQQVYKAAGIVPYSLDETGVPVVLMLKENRKRDGMVLNFLGGKIEKEDKQNPIETAIREFNEETNFIFDSAFLDTVRNDLNEQFPKNSVYLDFAKYYLFFAQVPWTPLSHHQNDQENLQIPCWVPLKEIIQAKDQINTNMNDEVKLGTFTKGLVVIGNCQRLLTMALRYLQGEASYSPVDKELSEAIHEGNVPKLTGLLLNYTEGDTEKIEKLVKAAHENLEERVKAKHEKDVVK